MVIGDGCWVKMEKMINLWRTRWLSSGGRLTLVKVVLEANLVYRHSLAWILKGVLENIRNICCKFIWSGKGEDSRIYGLDSSPCLFQKQERMGW